MAAVGFNRRTLLTNSVQNAAPRPCSRDQVTAIPPRGRLSGTHHEGVAHMTMTPDAASQGQGAISALLQEDRRYPPSDEFRAQANLNDPAIYDRARNDPE